MKSSRKKSKAQMRHALRRALQRFGVFFSKEDLQQMIAQIKNKKSRCLFVTSNRASVHEVFFKDKWYPVVYDCIRKTIVTFLPEQCREKEIAK